MAVTTMRRNARKLGFIDVPYTVVDDDAPASPHPQAAAQSAAIARRIFEDEQVFDRAGDPVAAALARINGWITTHRSAVMMTAAGAALLLLTSMAPEPEPERRRRRNGKRRRSRRR